MDWLNKQITSNKSNIFAFSIGLYSFVSIIFYLYPQVRKNNRFKIKANKRKVLVIAHRGGAGSNVENTIAAFDYATSIGVDMLELDCQLTKDGKVVVCHDNDLTRLCGVKMLISDLNYEELPDLLQHPIEKVDNETTDDLITNESVSNPMNINKKSDSKRIPLLETIFQKYPDMPINLDIKMNNNELIQKVYDLIVTHNRQNITIWGSFIEDVKKKCLVKNPDMQVYFSKSGCLKLFLLTITGLLPLVPLNESYFEILLPNFFLKRHAHQIPLLFRFLIHLGKLVFIRKCFIRHMQKRGISVFFWTLNNDEEFELALNMGVDGIITDYPMRLIEYLDKLEAK